MLLRLSLARSDNLICADDFAFLEKNMGVEKPRAFLFFSEKAKNPPPVFDNGCHEVTKS